jgi:hypothetical protein
MRPITYICQSNSPTWSLLVEITPFSENASSGHSMGSGAASETLTIIFGDNYAYRCISRQNFQVVL